MQIKWNFFLNCQLSFKIIFPFFISFSFKSFTTDCMRVFTYRKLYLLKHVMTAITKIRISVNEKKMKKKIPKLPIGIRQNSYTSLNRRQHTFFNNKQTKFVDNTHNHPKSWPKPPRRRYYNNMIWFEFDSNQNEFLYIHHSTNFFIYIVHTSKYNYCVLFVFSYTNTWTWTTWGRYFTWNIIRKVLWRRKHISCLHIYNSDWSRYLYNNRGMKFITEISYFPSIIISRNKSLLRLLIFRNFLSVLLYEYSVPFYLTLNSYILISYNNSLIIDRINSFIRKSTEFEI